MARRKERPQKKKNIFKSLFKKLMFGIFGLIAFVVVAAFAIPYFFKDELLEVTRKEMNKHIDAKADFSDVDISIFKNFPDLSLSINDVTIDGKGAFKDVRLADIKEVNLSMNLMSAVRPKDGEPIAVHSVGLVRPKLQVIVLKDGTANYDIVPSTEETTETSEPARFKLALSKYYIEEGEVIYDDRQGGNYVKVKGLNHSGKGNFTEAIYDIATTTKIKDLTLRSAGVSYLKKANLKADLTINADMNTSKFTLKDNNININALQIAADGWVQPQGDDINLDLNFNAPSTKFKDFLSLVPGAYTEDFKDVKTAGQFSLKGNTKGTYNEKQMPSFFVDMNVNNASFQYPDMPLGMKDIQAKIQVNSPSSDMDRMTVKIPQLHLLLGNNPFDAKLDIATPISDPQVNAIVDGVLDLNEISKAIPMEGVERMNGKITADVKMNTKMSYIDNKQYDKVVMDGNVQLENMDYVAKGLPAVLVNRAKMDFTPQHVQVNEFDAKIGKSDIVASGRLDNLLTYFSPGEKMKGKLKVRSRFFDANEWLSDESTEENPSSTPTDTTAVFDKFEFELDAAVDKIAYEDYTLENSVARGTFSPQQINFSRLETKIGKSDIRMKGKLTHIFDYLFDNKTLQGQIDLVSNTLDLNELMNIETATSSNTPTEEGQSANSTTSLVLVPDLIQVAVNADIDQVHYTNLDLKKLKGRVDVKDEKVSLTDVSANLLGGRMQLTGGYDTKDKTKPTFELGYDIDKFDFQTTFNTFNTFKMAAPVAEFIKGVFNSNLTMKGVMNPDMTPDLNTLSATGKMMTIDALIRNFAPLKSVGKQLNIKYLNDDIKLTNTINHFKIKNGKVLVDEFPFEYKGMKVRVGGHHGFDQNINYIMKLDVPMKMIGKGKVAGLANSGLNYLNQFASKAGLNLNQLNMGDMVQIDLQLTGDMKKPKVKVMRVQMSDADGNNATNALIDQATDMVNDKINEGKEIIEDKANEAIDKASEEVDKAIDKAEEVVNNKVEEVMDKVEDKVSEEADKILNDKVDEVKDKVGEEVKNKVDEALGDKKDEVKDAVKNELNKWNPFKKKNKNKEEN